MSENINGIIFDRDADGIVTLIMDLEGPVNAMNAQYRQAMTEVVERLEKEEGLTGVVLASAKNTFFAGGDLKELSSVPRGEEEAQFRMIEDEIKAPLRRLEKLQVPVVAAINGVALGGGLEICLACNQRVILNSPTAQIGFPEVTLGLLPGAGGVVRSIHLLGLEKALPFLLEGIRLLPEHALEAGFVNQLVDNAEDLVPAAKKWIGQNPDAWAQPWDTKGSAIPGGDIRSPQIQLALGSAPAMVFKKTRGLLPAPEQILSVASDAVTIGFDAALRVESRRLAYLITTPEAKNIITSSFFQMNKINSGASRPKGFSVKQFSRVGILGAGMMGQGIAYSTAVAGIDVVLKDVSVEAAEKGKAYTAKVFDKQIARGRGSEADKESALRRIVATDSYEALKDCDLIIEAVFEDVELKSKIIAEAEPFLAEGGVFASNTSALPITELAKAAARPENFVGAHFFSPVDKMPLVELIGGEKTSDQTLAAIFDYVRAIRKTPIVVNDATGFYTSRVFGSFLDEGARMLVEGIDPVLIESLSRQVGMPVGPLTVQDEIGQKSMSRASSTHAEVSGDKLVDENFNAIVANKLYGEHNRGGRHFGGGIYEYPEEGAKYIWPEIYQIFHKPSVQVPNQDIKDRVLFRQAIESLRSLQEGVLRSVADGNVGSLLGIGAPGWTGGWLQMINTWEHNELVGLSAFAARAKELADKYGDRFVAPEILQQKIEQAEEFV